MNIQHRVNALQTAIAQRQQAGLDTRRLESELRQALKDQQRSNGQQIKQSNRNNSNEE